MTTLMIIGAEITDQYFEVVIRGETLRWNVTRATVDARRGKFGEPHTYLMTDLPPQTPEAKANIDWQKVSEIAQSTVRLDEPCIGIGDGNDLPGYPPGMMVFIDGNHRLCARQLLGHRIFRSYVIPKDIEARYRIIIKEVEDQ